MIFQLQDYSPAHVNVLFSANKGDIGTIGNENSGANFELPSDVSPISYDITTIVICNTVPIPNETFEFLAEIDNGIITLKLPGESKFESMNAMICIITIQP